MPQTIAFFTLIAAFATVYFAVAVPLHLPPFSSDNPASINYEILVDRSGAMGQLIDGETKLAVAMDAIEEILDTKIWDGDNLALREFGGPCEGGNTNLVVPFGQNKKSDVHRELIEIGKQRPSGDTTLFRGIQGATADFVKYAQYNGITRKLIVVTSGVDTCHDDYIDLIEERMEDSPIEAEFWLITLDAPREAVKDLAEAARMGGWHTRNATSAEGLSSALAEAADPMGGTPIPIFALATPTVPALVASNPTPIPTIASITPTTDATPVMPCQRIGRSGSEFLPSPRVPPHVFVGSASTDDRRAREGVEVTAWVNGYNSGTGRVEEGNYIVLVHQSDDTDYSGSTVVFKVGDIVADKTGTWEQGGADELHLNARSECRIPP